MGRLSLVSVAVASVASLALAQPTVRVQQPARQGIAQVLGPQPDLRVTRLLFSQVDCNDSLCLKVQVDLHNGGEATNGPVDVRLSYRMGSGSQWTFLQTFHFAPQAHNHDTGASKRFAFKESGLYCFRAEIDPENKVQAPSPTKSRDSECKQYTAGIADPAPYSLTIRNCTNACTGFLRIQNVGDGKLSGTIKWALECSVNGKPFKKDRDRQDQYTLGPGQVSSQEYWVYEVSNPQTVTCRVTIYPTMRERTTINNTITSDLWRKP
jgi:hypothetical protein